MRRKSVISAANMVADGLGDIQVESTDTGATLRAQCGDEGIEIDLTASRCLDTAVALLMAAVPSEMRAGRNAEAVFDEFANRLQAETARVSTKVCPS